MSRGEENVAPRRSQGFNRDVASHRAARQARHETPPQPRRRRTPIYGFVAFGMLAAFLAPIAIQSTGLLDLRLPSSTPTATASLSVARISDRPVARPVSVCPPQFRRGGGGVTCVTDGDSGVEFGQAWRLTSVAGGVDAPEIGSPDCSAERSAGERARNRLLSLMSGGYRMRITGTDRYDRQLVVVTLADGQDAGEVLIDEGLAQPWPNSGNPWC